MTGIQLNAVPHQWQRLAAVVAFWLATLAILVGAGILSAFVPVPFSSLAWGITSSLVLFGLTVAFLHWEGRGVGSVGLRFRPQSLVRFGVGIAVGGALYGLYMLVLLSLTEVRIVPSAAIPVATVGLALATYLVLAVMEEIGFRGYALRRLEERVGRVSAVALGAVPFGALHLAYGWTPGAAIVGAGAGALLFGTAALVSRGLAVSIGLHAAWNVVAWSVGEKGGGGLWHIVVPEPASRAATVGKVSYLLVMAIGCIGFWQFGRIRARREARVAEPAGA